MRTYRVDSILTAEGWRHDTTLSVSDEGLITAIGIVPDAATERVRGAVVPGMPNAHSHAFQRAMAGDAEFRSGARESFWTWRTAMYALANSVDPAELELIATQLYIEMLRSGYTSVAEFHYLHHVAPGSAAAADRGLWDALDRAAQGTGIALTLLPALYMTSDFGNRPLLAEQRRFGMSVASFLDAVSQRRARARSAERMPLYTGAALHSLRAVPLAALTEVVQGLRAQDPSGVLHIHVAEQLREVAACVEHTGYRPIELLLGTGLIDAHWCLVHATHATAAEIRAVAASGASVCVCPGTEGNLGDGFFDAGRLLRARGRLCIGSDSQVSIDPAEELRWLEYQQRIRHRSRSVLATRKEPNPGARLWREAAAAGAAALGQPVGTLAEGRRADWLVLDPDHPALAGAAEDRLLDRLVFGASRGAIRHVMVAGRWVIRDGGHANGDAAARRFSEWQAARARAT